jgi:hypothetical protein
MSAASTRLQLGSATQAVLLQSLFYSQSTQISSTDFTFDGMPEQESQYQRY